MVSHLAPETVTVKTDPSHLWTKRHGWIVCQTCLCDIYSPAAGKPCRVTEHKAR